VFIDYRHFQKAGIAPTWEFGFGLSYTSFDCSGLKVVAHTGQDTLTPAQMVNEGMTEPASTFGTLNRSVAANVPPAGFTKVWPYIYPWLSGPNVTIAQSTAAITAATNGSSQRVLPAGGAPGGNPRLYEVMYTISADIKNTGPVSGTEIPQLYVQLGGEENPWGVLRGFDEVALQPGETKTVKFELTRRDISNWNTTSQNWEIWNKQKFVFVGSSSNRIRLNATLPTPPGMVWI